MSALQLKLILLIVRTRFFRQAAPCASLQATNVLGENHSAICLSITAARTMNLLSGNSLADKMTLYSLIKLTAPL